MAAQSLPQQEQEPAFACVHVWTHFLLPGESKGRVLQCSTCGVIGYRKSRYGGGGRIELYKCSRERCKGDAVRRMTGRGPRGSYIWACTEHSVLIEGPDRPT
jgi:hypothetical protein